MINSVSQNKAHEYNNILVPEKPNEKNKRKYYCKNRYILKIL